MHFTTDLFHECGETEKKEIKQELLNIGSKLENIKFPNPKQWR
jgi:hypothetical protein